MVLRALGWIAVSTKAQADEDKDSLKNQERLFRAWCTANDALIVDLLEVPGHSRNYIDIHEAASDMRKAEIYAFDNLMHHWKARDFDVLWCLDGDRFARTQTLHAYVAETTIVANGGRIYSHMDGWVDERNVRMWIAMSGAKAAGHKDRAGVQWQAGMKKRIERGLTSTRPPLTHRLIRDEKTGKALSVVVNEAMRPMFDVIARLLIEGKGMRVISYRLNDLGFRNPRTHKPYTDITIRWILFNPYTWGHAAWNWNSQIGHWAYDETLPVPESVIIQRNAVPPVWTGETAEAIKAALHERQRSGTVQRNAGYFTRLMVCDACGRGLTSTGAGIESMQYFCVGRYYAPNPCADAYFIRATYIRDWLTARLTDILDSADGFSVLVGGENPTVSVQSELAALALNYAQQQAELDNMVQDMASTVSRPVRDALLKAMDAKGEALEALELRMATLRETLSEMETPTDNTTRLQTLDELRANGIDWLWAQPSEDVNRLLRRVFGAYRLVVRNGKIIGVKKGV